MQGFDIQLVFLCHGGKARNADKIFSTGAAAEFLAAAMNQKTARGQAVCIEPTSCEAMEPKAIWVKPDQPAAAPVMRESTEIAPAVPLGMVRPLPKAASDMGRNRVAGERKPVTAAASAGPRCQRLATKTTESRSSIATSVVWSRLRSKKQPAAVTATVATLHELAGRIPIFGICLGHQVLALALAAPAAPALPGYVSRLTDDHTLEIEVSKEQSLNDIFARLTQQGVEVASMRNKVNRLEELFMHLVESRGAPGAKAG